MTRLHLVADDLTGALDSAAQFTGLIGAFPVLLRPDMCQPPGSFALDLGCRDRPESDAVARTRETAARLLGAHIAFKKIDSLLRGHWAAELAVIAKGGLFRRIVFAPAFPQQGRVMRQGRQHARDARGAWACLDVDPAERLLRRGVPTRLGLHEGGAEATSLIICDAETEADLDLIAAEARRMPGPTLFCGTAGLARALAGVPPAQWAPVAGSHLMILGSNHPVSLRQWEVLATHPSVARVLFGCDVASSAAQINLALAMGRPCAIAADLPPRLVPEQAAIRIAAGLHALLPHLVRPSTLTVVGGETFAAACAALDAEALSVEGEWRAGLPASRMVGGRWDGLPCLSKSGAFGGPGDLLDLLL